MPPHLSINLTSSLSPQTMLSWSQHVHALLLAIVSSTDNFAVGFSVGIKRRSLPILQNAFIAVCNAAGALAATSVGSAISFAPLLASLGFAYLGWNEYRSDTTVQPLTLSLALPMTLNNLAGGVAGGVAGISPSISAGYALVASLVAMACGHSIGLRVVSSRKADASLVAAIIYFSLSLLTLYEKFR